MATRFEKIDAEVKEQVWQLGRRAAPDADFEDVFYKDYGESLANKYGEKYRYDHYVKLNTLFFDARNGSTTLQDYNTAIIRFANFAAPVNAKSKGMMLASEWQFLQNLINSTNVSLPGGGDILSGESQIASRKPIFVSNDNSKERRQKDREMHRQQQKAYRQILLSVTRLINHVLDTFVTGCSAQATKQQQFTVGALNGCGILKTMHGYPAGKCHLEMYKHLTAAISKIIRD